MLLTQFEHSVPIMLKASEGFLSRQLAMVNSVDNFPCGKVGIIGISKKLVYEKVLFYGRQF